ncbi:M17 family metallopeptidase [Candidatus Gromoviella agglomerans]|uniref:M17 family metallopeptidase n=1 Tax=Candidatus Gromoviella agglomerans TaxID=2806609 RepID=UPI001E4E1478|nr:leucyl aminopeptidase [Candidatus Gromoviella agglomerans]UFX98522.1 Cytosol aminopeptidase [Candidatus Gromoviella agglomerans]
MDKEFCNDSDLSIFDDFSIAKASFDNSDFVSFSINDTICIPVNTDDNGRIELNSLHRFESLKNKLGEFSFEFLNKLQFVKTGDNISFFMPTGIKLVIFSLGSRELSKPDIDLLSSNLLHKFENHSTVHFLLDSLDEENRILIMSSLISHSYNFVKYKKNNLRQWEFKFYNCNQNWQNEYNIILSICISKTLSNYSPNTLYPIAYASLVKNIFKSTKMKVTIINHEELQRLNMHALYSVGKGSQHKPCAVIMEWNNGTNDPVSILGKGVTFDSGGISIKPSQDMEDMKFDMSGSAVVVATMFNIAKNDLNINTIGVIGLAENMPSSSALKPSDVISSMSGKTIEILNTDAEGRLILADILWYVQDIYNSRKVIDLATLTGAIVTTFGSEYAGLFSNDEEFSQEFLKIAKESKEKFWPLPMDDAYDKVINSKIADVRNISKGYKGAGSITAAKFLQRFIKSSTSWIHLDIAGVSYKSDQATGFGVRSLYNWINNQIL